MYVHVNTLTDPQSSWLPPRVRQKWTFENQILSCIPFLSINRNCNRWMNRIPQTTNNVSFIQRLISAVTHSASGWFPSSNDSTFLDVTVPLNASSLHHQTDIWVSSEWNLSHNENYLKCEKMIKHHRAERKADPKRRKTPLMQQLSVWSAGESSAVSIMYQHYFWLINSSW